MILFNQSELQSLCRRYRLTPSKKYGQNYLLDPAVVDALIAAANIGPDDTVIEIGPGFGTLTFALAAAGRVVAFEIEKKLQTYWEELKNNPDLKKIAGLSGLDNVRIEWGDVLKLAPTVVARLSTSAGPGAYKVVANLPYQITSPVIRLFLETAAKPPVMMALTVQKEVAERICAKPGAMSLLSVSVQYYGRPEIVAIVPRQSFWPQPSVDSAVIKISAIRQRDRSDARRKADVAADQQFFKLVKAGFANRRKLLIKNLAALSKENDQINGNRSRIEEIFSALGVSLTARAQELSVAQWKLLADALQ